MSRILILSTIGLLLGACSESPSGETTDGIDRIEPPFWWQGFRNRELQLLVHGDDIDGLSASVDYRGISVERLERGDSPNYLFVYLDIAPSAAPGTFDIVFSDEDRTLSHAYELRQKNDDPAYTKSFDSSDVVYLITPDRFANGDESNDTVDGYDDTLNREDDFGRHGGDLAGVAQNLNYIAAMGFTQIWLNPILENAMPAASYHGYATTDFYKVDPRFGSNESYRELVAEARKQGIGTIMDMIANHAGSNHWWMDDLPTMTWLNIPETRTMTSHARTTNQDPYAAEFDKREFADGWFVDTMPDLNQRDPLLADYLVQNAIWWIEYVGLSGIRQDTYPYPDKHFMAEWTHRIMSEYPDFNMVGEEWSPSPAIVSYWQRGKRNHDDYVSSMPSLMDFPLQIAFSSVLSADEPPWGSVWTPVYEMLGHDFLYPDPFNLMIMPDNHDMSRIYTQLDENYDRFRMAMVFYLSMRGIPQIYYGTEVLMSHPGTDSHGAIREEFPGGWSDHEEHAATGDGLSDEQLAAQGFMRRLLQWRKQANVIHNGKLMQYAPIKNVYAYFRYDDNDTVMVVFNSGDESVTIESARFAERIGEAKKATDVITGETHDISPAITLEPHSVLLLEFTQ